MEPDVKAVNELIDSFKEDIKDIDINIGEEVTNNSKDINITNSNKTVDMHIELNNGNTLDGNFTIEKDKVGSQVGNYTMYSIYLMLKAIKSIDNKINKVKDSNNKDTNKTQDTNNNKEDSNGEKWTPQELKKRKQSIKDIKEYKEKNGKESLFNKFKTFIKENELDVSKISNLNPNQMEDFRDHIYT